MNSKHFHIIGNPEDRRVKMFCDDAKRLGHQTSQTPYLEALEMAELGEPIIIPDIQILRLESPGESAIINGKILSLGGVSEPLLKGEVRDQKAWMHGFSKLLTLVKAKQYFTPPEDVRDMFDKVEMYNRLAKAGCSVPQRMLQVKSIKPLKNREKPIRLFVKPRFGSSASGVLACSIKQDFVKCVTSLEMDGDRFFNSLKIRTYIGQDAEKCINFILSEGAVVEKWFPKATLKNGPFDLRILCIAGKASHIVVRVSRSPMTNLHLGNERGTLQSVEERFGKGAIQLAKSAAEIAAKAFPDAHYMGVDVALSVDGKRAVVFEVNAFGDLLPGILHRGLTTYGAEILTIAAK